jgi:RimJ/RimL family protein N-acetyltransferase
LRYYEWSSRAEEEVRQFVQAFIDQQNERPRTMFQFAVTLEPEGRLIGNCGIRKRTSEAFEADMGYEIDPDFWGNGYATEAARAVLAFGFEQLALHRVWANCIAENRASAHVLEKIGMQLEGRLRENVRMKGRWWDTLIYAILDREWQETR